MSVYADQPAVRLPLVKLTAVMLGAVVVATGLGAAAATMAVPGSVQAALMAGAVVMVAVGIGLVPLAAAGPKPAVTVAMIWIAGSTLRIAAAVGMGVFLYLMLGLELYAFWGAAAFGLTAALIADVLIVIPHVRAAGIDEASERDA